MDGFDWHDQKNTLNLKNHGVSLAAGIPVFDDEFRMEYQDKREAYGEDRFITIGHNSYSDVLYVCYTMREHGTTWLISVRRATRKERLIYEKNARW